MEGLPGNQPIRHLQANAALNLRWIVPVIAVERPTGNREPGHKNPDSESQKNQLLPTTHPITNCESRDSHDST